MPAFDTLLFTVFFYSCCSWLLVILIFLVIFRCILNSGSTVLNPNVVICSSNEFPEYVEMKIGCRHFRLSANVIGMSSLIFARRCGFGCGIVDHNCNLLEVKPLILSINFSLTCMNVSLRVYIHIFDCSCV